MFFFFLRLYVLIFIDRGRKEEREGEKPIYERYIVGCLTHAPQPRAWSETQACALIGNQTGDLLVRRLALNPLSHTNQGWAKCFTNTKLRDPLMAGAQYISQTR